MAKDRTGYDPWSLTREAGVQSATVDGTIKVPQNIQPVLSTGFVDYKGNWKGTASSDESFFLIPIIDKTQADVIVDYSLTAESEEYTFPINSIRKKIYQKNSDFLSQ